jgi:transposase-like protein
MGHVGKVLYGEEVAVDARRLHGEGVGVTEIGRRFGVSPTLVRCWVDPEYGERRRESRRAGAAKRRKELGKVRITCPSCGRVRFKLRWSGLNVEDGAAVHRCHACANFENFTPQRLRDRAWLAAAYTTHSQAELIEIVGCSKDALRSWLGRHGIEMRDPYLPKPQLIRLRDKAWLTAQYAEFSAAAIGRTLGCAPTTVVYWLDKHGIPRRGKRAAIQFTFADQKHGRGKRFGRNRQMVSGRGFNDKQPGHVRHFGA